MATTRNGVVTENRVVTIRGFSFDWILFPVLARFFPKRAFDRLFNCIENRGGVYYFFNNESGKVSYVGCIENRGIKVRINQYRTRSKTGNSFWTAYQKQHSGLSFDHFKTHVQDLRLGTLSIDITNLTGEQQTKLIAVNKDMENALICMLKPAYNAPRYRLTDDEHCRLTSLNVLPNSSSPENSSGW